MIFIFEPNRESFLSATATFVYDTFEAQERYTPRWYAPRLVDTKAWVSLGVGLCRCSGFS